MKIIRNNIIPFKGFAAINLFGVLFVRKDVTITPRIIQHESIHTEQMKEMLYIFFYLWYCIEWLINLIRYLDFHKAYKMISFEREAYKFELYTGYLNERKHYSWFKYLNKDTI